MPDFCSSLIGSGYGSGARLYIDTLRALSADTDCSLETYWREIAKERISCGCEPYDVIKGACKNGYRSSLLQGLRTQRSAFQGVGAVSRNRFDGITLHPAISAFHENLLDDGYFANFWRQIRSSRLRSIDALRRDFRALDAGENIEYSYESYSSYLIEQLRPASAGRDVKSAGLILRWPMSDSGYDFFLADNSQGSLYAGKISITAGVVNSRRRIDSRKMPASCLTSFPLSLLVPGLEYCLSFFPSNGEDAKLSFGAVAVSAAIVRNAVQSNS